MKSQKTVDIQTSQNVTIEYDLASTSDRFLSFLIDFFIIAFFCILVWIVFGYLITALHSKRAGTLIVFIVLFIFLGYFTILENFMQGQTLGKRIMGLRVIKLDGKDPGFFDFFLRDIFHLIDTLSSFGALAGILISTTDRKQRFGDLAANTTVIKLKFESRFNLNDIKKLISLETHQPTYPQVKQMKESDMLLIKRVISRYNQYHNPAHIEAVEEVCLKIQELLDIPEIPANRIEFLNKLITDYIAITR